MSSAPSISVVVCTRNRSGALGATLDALLALDAGASWELLVVDNASTDDTLAVARAVERRRPDRVRVAVEAVLGLSAARNLGVRLARGELILFLDDDAFPAPGWLDAYRAALAEPGVLSAGGPVEPLYEGELPAWLGQGFLPYLSVWDLGPAPLDLRYIELPRGANVGFRREAFELVGGFDRRLGRAGASLRSCEEIELGLRIERSGFRTRYVPAARVRHRVEASRLTPDWMVRRFAAQGFSEAIVDWKHFGRAGLESGRSRRLEVVARLRSEESGDSLRLRCARRDARAYLLGTLYALGCVERWNPTARPAGGDPPSDAQSG